MKNLGWVQIWHDLMETVNFDIQSVSSFETMHLPKMPAIFRNGHVVNESGKRISDAHPTSHRENSTGLCVGHAAAAFAFNEWPACTRGDSCAFDQPSSLSRIGTYRS